MNRRQFIQKTSCASIAYAFSGTQVFSIPLEDYLEYNLSIPVFGTIGNIRMYASDQIDLSAIQADCLAEIQRMESLYSLYEPNSFISKLNKEGFLKEPPGHFIETLKKCVYYHRITNGYFDPTIQVLWNLYASWFRKNPTDTKGPAEDSIAACLDRVGLEKVHFNQDLIRFEKEGMGLSFNGIIQGCLTDQITDILRRYSIRHALVNMGEFRAIGSKPNKQAWKIAIKKLENKAPVTLNNKAIATSGGYGTRFGAHTSIHHLLNPKQGHSSQLYESLSVIADTATEADALSTGFYMMSLKSMKQLAKQLNVQVVI